MLRVALTVGFLLFALVGCAARDVTIAPTTNVLLDADADNAILASIGPSRTAWPSTPSGLRIEDSTYYQIYTYDSQYWVTPNDGALWTTSASQRSGVLLR